jgi:predicted anti-sigma-YlaC factor YlaD
MIIEISCVEVRLAISDFVDGNASGELGQRMKLHLSNCRDCSAIVNGVRNLVHLTRDLHAFKVPQRFATRLYVKLDQFMHHSRRLEADREICSFERFSRAAAHRALIQLPIAS